MTAKEKERQLDCCPEMTNTVGFNAQTRPNDFLVVLLCVRRSPPSNTKDTATSGLRQTWDTKNVLGSQVSGLISSLKGPQGAKERPCLSERHCHFQLEEDLGYQMRTGVDRASRHCSPPRELVDKSLD